MNEYKIRTTLVITSWVEAESEAEAQQKVFDSLDWDGEEYDTSYETLKVTPLPDCEVVDCE